ncbi:MAG: lysylphosphatidylglycerol synthase transmembrane domain-containing protein [Leptospira sp.]|nr:lysylphosphatidylglycerol synthase transmembrane domain-containing protein [Leptospira sp.]
MKKWILGVTISAIAIYFLLKNFDLNAFEKLKGNIQWKYLFFLILSNLWSYIPFTYRWYLLLDKNISFKSAYSSSVIGVGLNMVLPARGGDLIRLLINKNDSGLPLPNLLSKIFLEKVMDLGMVVLIGVSALFFLGLGENKNLSLVYISCFVLIAMFGGLIALRLFLEPIRNLLKVLFGLIKQEEFYLKTLDHHLIEFSEFLKGRKLIWPLMITFPTWLFGYALSYWFTSQMIGIHLDYPEILLIMFVGALGVAIPSAPSGIGVFHASVIYGFLLLGRASDEGFVFATVIHLAQFVILTSLAIFFYLVWTVFSKGKRNPKV